MTEEKKAADGASEGVSDSMQLLERIAELDAANTGLAMESHRLRELLREVSCMLHMWDGGLDRMDGKEWHEACDVWDGLLPKIDEELSRTDPPTPQEILAHNVLDEPRRK